MITKTLNILQIINEPWTSGITEYGLILSRGLKKRGHKVIIAGLKGAPAEDEAKKNNIGYEIINNINSLSPFNIYNSINQIKNILVKYNINIINAHRAEGHSLGYFASKLTGNKAVLARTRGDQRIAKNNFLNRYLYRNLTDIVIVASRLAKENHFKGFDIEEKIKVIPPAVDTLVFNPSVSGEKFRINYGVKKDEILIGIIGRLDPVKGHFYLFEAAGKIKDIFPLIKYAVIGKEENVKFEQLKKIADSFGLKDKIIYTGFYKNVSEAIAAIDIGVIASIGSEAISRVCLEMMACGKPVIASMVGSIPEMIKNGETGLLYEPKDSKMLADHIQNLMQKLDLLKKIGQNAFLSVKENFTVDKLVENTENAYFEAIETKWKKSQ